MISKSGQIKENALVLRSIRHGETSRIVTLLGQTLGKFAVAAKGIRSGKNRAGTLDVPSLVEIIVFYKPNRSVQNMGTVTTLNDYGNIKASLTATGYSAAVLELLNRMAGENEQSTELYDIALSTLESLNETTIDPGMVLWKFQMDLMRAQGFGLDPFSCPVCGTEMVDVERRNFLLLDVGAFCCKACLNNGNNNRRELSGESVSLIRRLVDDRIQGLSRIKPSSLARKELSMVLEHYIRYHHPEIGTLPALNMLGQLEE